MHDLQHLIDHHGLALLFLNVLLEQIGLPVPAYPALIVAGAMGMQGKLSLPGAFGLALVAGLIADLAWYYAGKHLGGKLLRRICKLSLSQDTCVRQGLNLYQRTGPRALLVARFMPGASALFTSMAGMNALPMATFLRYSIAGSALWAGTALAIGMLFSDALDVVLAWLASYAVYGAMLVGAALLSFIGWKYWKRTRLLRRTGRIPRISADELQAMQDAGKAPVIIDVRIPHLRHEQGIPGAIPVTLESPLEDITAQLIDVDVVIYCACPNELSAALLAERLQGHGITRSMALLGGLEAWALQPPQVQPQ